MNFIRILKILCSINTTKRVLRRFKKGLKNKFVLLKNDILKDDILKDDILKDDKGIKEYPKITL
ncbi:hypothetical protein KVE52_04625 [Helicobacter pylori]|nr:hypothetical protein KVE52_04625 [Helicobacter pylori]